MNETDQITIMLTDKEKKAIYDKARYAADPERFIKENKARYDANPEKNKAQSKKWAQNNKDKRKIITDRYVANHPEKRRESIRKYEAKQKEKRKLLNPNLITPKKLPKTIDPEILAKRVANNKAKKREYDKIYRSKNLTKLNANNLAYTLKRIKVDPLFRAKAAIRAAVRNGIKHAGYIKKSKTTQILGCSLQEAKLHIEKQFKPGMNWLNHSLHGWHIDHIIPMASATTEEEVIKLNHYTNLQPLWASENIKKSNKMPDELDKLEEFIEVKP
jgi:hypothetical protein